MPSPRYKNAKVRPAWYRQRQRHLTAAQRRAEKRLWPIYGLAWTQQNADQQTAHQTISLDHAFANCAAAKETPRRVLELGCGAGEALAELALRRPDAQFVGVDWFRGALAGCLQRIDENHLDNVRLVRGDASTVVGTALPAEPLFDEVFVLFPDPWVGSPERRLVRLEAMADLTARMRAGGVLRLGTDVADYPAHARRVLELVGWVEESCEALERELGPGFVRPDTKYARKARDEGREVCDVCFRLAPGAEWPP
jgi:tRNA (guanine-N7-)-methyltransferase